MISFKFKKTPGNPETFFRRAGNDPYFDWAAILLISFIAAVVFVGFSVRLFLQTNADANSSSAGMTTSAPAVGVTLDTTDLVNLVSIFESKKAQAPVFAATYPGPGDPAIPVKAAKTVSK